MFLLYGHFLLYGELHPSVRYVGYKAQRQNKNNKQKQQSKKPRILFEATVIALVY